LTPLDQIRTMVRKKSCGEYELGSVSNNVWEAVQ